MTADDLIQEGAIGMARRAVDRTTRTTTTASSKHHQQPGRRRQALVEAAGLTDRQLHTVMKVRERRNVGILSFERWTQQGKNYTRRDLVATAVVADAANHANHAVGLGSHEVDADDLKSERRNDLGYSHLIMCTEGKAFAILVGVLYRFVPNRYVLGSVQYCLETFHFCMRFPRPRKMEALSWRKGLNNNNNITNTRPTAEKSPDTTAMNKIFSVNAITWPTSSQQQ